MKDYIEREKAIELVKNYGKGAISDGMKTLDPVDDIVAIVKGFDLLPAEKVAPVMHGKWEKFDRTCEVEYICSNCNFSIIEADPKQKIEFIYCPMCGAKNE